MFIPVEPGFMNKELAVRSYLSVEQLVRLKDWFIFVHNLKKRFNKTTVRKYFNKLNEYDRVAKEIDAKIDNSHQIRDQASEELSKVRIEKRKLKKRMKEKLDSILLNRSNVFTEANVFQRSGRYVLPVKRNFKKDVQGIVHSYSNTGETVFVEPIEITDDSALLVELNDREKEEIERILKELTVLIREHGDEIEADIEIVIDLDLLLAKVRFAEDLNARLPVFGETLNIVNGYHPILKRIGENVVPLNLKIGADKKILLISGPNAGGKTVVLKTVGLIVQMAKCGMFIPAEEGSIIPFFDKVYADIGDEQSIESNLSTFAGHIKQIKGALDADSYSLVLLDELMSQTSVEEGSALAAAILEEFARRRSLVLATTHNEDLKIFVSRRTDMINGGMEFTDRPTYRLILGIPQPSNAIKLAKGLGINGGIIESAQKFLDKDKMSLNKLFEDLSKELKGVQEERTQLSALIKEYESKLQDLNVKKKKTIDEMKAKYKHELIQAKRSIEKLIKDIKKEGPKPETVHKMRHFFDKKLEVEEARPSYYPRIGELVRIRDLKKVGQVIAEHSGKYKVSLENIYYWVEANDIESAEKDN